MLDKMKGLEWDGYQNDKEECKKSRAPLKERILGTKYGKYRTDYMTFQPSTVPVSEEKLTPTL